MEHLAADILHMVRPDQAAPNRLTHRRPREKRFRIRQHVVIYVIPDETAPAKHVQSGRLFVCTDWRALTVLDPRIQYADLAVFQQDGVVVWRHLPGIQCVGCLVAQLMMFMLFLPTYIGPQYPSQVARDFPRARLDWVLALPC